jgi:D-alanyl-lipoteichoic acid acyltransferase DltB (MBOAT superfamily)
VDFCADFPSVLLSFRSFQDSLEAVILDRWFLRDRPQIRSVIMAVTSATPLELPVATYVATHTAAKDVLDPREARSTRHLGAFVVLAAQLAVLLFVFRLYHLTEKPSLLVRLLELTFGAFLIHYWIPFRFKETFWVLTSIAGSFLLLETRIAVLLIAVGLLLFLIFRSEIPNVWRIVLLALIFATFSYGCATKALPIPADFYAVFGAIFMFRIIIYAYDLAHSKEPARLLPFLSYFFLLPNFYFTLFPVIDFQTMRRTYYQRDIHEIAQQGIHWMTRGAIQLMLYRLVVYFNDSYLPDRVTSLGALITTMVLTFLLYLNVSGKFHLIVGMLHLFGYDLPETNKRYLLASSFVDFWRRANIYWKDFMVKIVYFPVYFKLRKKGEVPAQVVATATVFLVTWALHSYQFFWLRDRFIVSWPDTLFWTILGILVIANVLYETRHKRRQRISSWHALAGQALQVLGTLAVITTLWSLWSSPSVSAWLYLTTHWIRNGS